MRTLAVGDIHGCFTALQTLAEFVPFQLDDRLITLGDYVNRGPNSRGVLEWLIDRQQVGNLVALRGNHECMMLDARKGGYSWAIWLGTGGRATLASYTKSSEERSVAAIPADHWRFLENTRTYYETDTHLFVHANAIHDCDLAEQPDYMLLWEFFDNPRPHQSGKVMICGHTCQKSGKPLSIGHAVCIDTGAGFDGGWLTCLDVESGRYWQANEDGRTRAGRLHD